MLLCGLSSQHLPDSTQDSIRAQMRDEWDFELLVTAGKTAMQPDRAFVLYLVLNNTLISHIGSKAHVSKHFANHLKTFKETPTGSFTESMQLGLRASSNCLSHTGQLRLGSFSQQFKSWTASSVCGARQFSGEKNSARRPGAQGKTFAAGESAAAAPQTTTNWTLTKQQRSVLDRMIRVDHAGELGARQIYAGQLRILAGTPAAAVIEHMAEQERQHAAVFEKLVVEYRVRPTVLLPLWRLAGYALGAGTALLGREAAMACTVAVEEVIAQHYDDQLRELIAMERKEPSTGTSVQANGPMKQSPEAKLRQYIRQFRDDELEHKDTGIAHGAELAPAYRLLSLAIQTGCRAAIFLSERI
jgi:ubiquinone biosynthesis monooxygenase Coq7